MLGAIRLQDPSDSSLKFITLGVLLLHLAFVFSLSLYPLTRDASKVSKEKIVVKTVVLREAKEPASASKVKEREVPLAPTVQVDLEPTQSLKEPVEELIQEPIREQVQTPKLKKENDFKQTPKPEVKKEPAKKKPQAKPLPKKEPLKKEPTKKPVTKKELPKKATSEKKVEASPKLKPDPALEEKKAKQKQLLAKAQENMAKINVNRDKLAQAKKQTAQGVLAPTALGALHIDSIQTEGTSALTVREMGYRDELASRLKLLLKLPEHGEVKLKLTLERSGSVEKVIILSAENVSNRKYIEKTLPTLTFPSFGDNFGDHKNYTFLISLGNE